MSRNQSAGYPGSSPDYGVTSLKDFERWHGRWSGVKLRQVLKLRIRLSSVETADLASSPTPISTLRCARHVCRDRSSSRNHLDVSHAETRSTVLTPPSFHSAGPILIGNFFNWGLFGVLTLQVCKSTSESRLEAYQ